MVLLEFLKWFQKKNTGTEIHCIALKGGVLEPEFKNASNYFTNLSSLLKKEKSLIEGFFEKILKKTGFFKKKYSKKDIFLKSIVNEQFDLVYANTIVCLPIATEIKLLYPKIKLFLHIHELNNMISYLIPDFKQYLKNIDFYIAVSKKVRNNLIENYNISSEKIEIIYEFVKDSPIKRIQKSSDFLVGGAGSINLRKGVDLFISVAACLHRNNPELKIKFVWIGDGDRYFLELLKQDLEKLNIDEKVDFLGSKDEPGEFYNQLDLFLMTSREDPFPLVCIEAGMLKKPIICFKSATGTEEILNIGGGKIVPYMDVNAMANAIIQYYENHDALRKDGEKAYRLFSKFSPQIQCPKILTLLQNNL